MKLIVHELTGDGLLQELTSPRNIIMVAVRPHLYRHNFATGTLKMQVLNSDDDVLAESESVSIEDIGSEDFFHGYVRFMIDVGLQKDQVYKFKLVGEDGYSFDEASYIGWCNGYDLGKYEATYDTPTAVNHPLDIEIWERTP